MGAKAERPCALGPLFRCVVFAFLLAAVVCADEPLAAGSPTQDALANQATGTPKGTASPEHVALAWGLITDGPDDVPSPPPLSTTQATLDENVSLVPDAALNSSQPMSTVLTANSPTASTGNATLDRATARLDRMREGPQCTGRKLDAENTSYIPCHGLSAVLPMAPSSFRTWVRELYSALAADPVVVRNIILLPPSSYHVTLQGLEYAAFRGALKDSVNASRLLALDSALRSEVPTIAQFRMDLRNVPKPTWYNVESKNNQAIGFPVRAADDATESRLRAAEAACYDVMIEDRFKRSVGRPAAQKWHMSLGYWSRGGTTEDMADAHRRVYEYLRQILPDDGLLEVAPPSVCTYASMNAFPPLFTPPPPSEPVPDALAWKTMGLLPRRPFRADAAALAPFRETEAPEPRGSLVFVTAPSGMGKSVTGKAIVAHLRERGRAAWFYEGDALLSGAVPFEGQAPAGEAASGTQFLPDVHDGLQAASDRLIQAVVRFLSHSDHPEPTLEDSAPFLRELCDDVRAEWTRLGGTLVVAFAIYTREARDLVRARLADLQPRFVTLHGTEALNSKRLARRNAEMGHTGGSEHRMKGFEPAAADEPRTVGIELPEADDLPPPAVAAMAVECMERPTPRD